MHTTQFISNHFSWRNGRTTRGTPERLGSRTRTGPTAHPQANI